MAEEAKGEETDDQVTQESEPERMSWFVFLFMSMCLFMTAVMTYYAWNVFVDAV